jgi:arylesterase / paraoxonase
VFFVLNNTHSQYHWWSELVIHQPSGLVYLACSTQESRTQWSPPCAYFNASGASLDDYVAVFNPQSRKVTRLGLTGFNNARALSLHGMDVVPDSEDPNQLWVYLVNHRVPLEGDPAKVGADSVVEVFKTYLESPTLEHIRTVEDERIITPNDLIGSDDGKSFYVTNDRAAKTGFVCLSVPSQRWRLAYHVSFAHIDQRA